MHTYFHMLHLSQVQNVPTEPFPSLPLKVAPFCFAISRTSKEYLIEQKGAS